jgi:hypothetical protein
VAATNLQSATASATEGTQRASSSSSVAPGAIQRLRDQVAEKERIRVQFNAQYTADQPDERSLYAPRPASEHAEADRLRVTRVKDVKPFKVVIPAPNSNAGSADWDSEDFGPPGDPDGAP